MTKSNQIFMSHYESTGYPRSLNGFCQSEKQLATYGKQVYYPSEV